MAPFILGALLNIGSTLLRGVGQKKGGVAAIAANAVADAMDHGKMNTPVQAEAVLNGLPADQRAEVLSLINEGERIKADLEAKKIDAASKDFAQEQETHRAEATSTDDYTRRTRPHIARLSFYAGTLYAFSGIIVPLTGSKVQVDFDTVIYLALISPALTYMGVRTFDKVASLMTKRTK